MSPFSCRIHPSNPRLNLITTHQRNAVEENTKKESDKGHAPLSPPALLPVTDVDELGRVADLLTNIEQTNMIDGERLDRYIIIGDSTGTGQTSGQIQTPLAGRLNQMQ